MLKSEQGFTLIEVVAVLVILGILIVVAVPRYIDLIKQAKISSAHVEVAEMKSTLNLVDPEKLIFAALLCYI
jgi:MSHA pilin protein MshA